MVKCAVQGCPNRKDRDKDKGTTNKRFFSFPQDPGRIKVWLAALRETEKDPSELSEICEDHFLPDHIMPQGISEDAIPLPPYLDGPVGASESSEGEQEEGPSFTSAPVDSDDDGEEMEDEEEEEDEGEELEGDDNDGLSQENGVEDMQKQDAPCKSVKKTTESQTNAEVIEEGEGTRYDVSLGRLTHLFMRLLSSAPDGVLDLNEAACKLGTRKRRVYDITNVLDGINLIQKKSTNKVHWVGSTPITCFNGMFHANLKEEVQNLKTMEESLDTLIKDCARQLFALTDDKENVQYPFRPLCLGYICVCDLCHITAFQEQTLIAIRAPEETKLDVPTPREDGIHMHLKGTRGPIHVLTCEMAAPTQGLDSCDKPAGFLTLEESRIRTAPLKTGEGLAHRQTKTHIHTTHFFLTALLTACLWNKSIETGKKLNSQV
ncbi:hypothetical protein ACEWY4_022361 [Coilia grayii]|uniref:THAP-type domain-containing protein n=1 Tax=Coilia grayii TaxID=363190 RepID=A0ABD1J5T0_9TELE